MMKKILLLCSTFIFSSLTQGVSKCYIQSDVTNSNSLFSYKGNVYDTTNYVHPGGQAKIKILIGNDLADFVNANSYSFHLKSGNRFFTQMNN